MGGAGKKRDKAKKTEKERRREGRRAAGGRRGRGRPLAPVMTSVPEGTREGSLARALPDLDVWDGEVGHSYRTAERTLRHGHAAGGQHWRARSPSPERRGSPAAAKATAGRSHRSARVGTHVRRDWHSKGQRSARGSSVSPELLIIHGSLPFLHNK